MFISRFRKTVSFLLFVTMSFSLMHHSSIHSIATEALPEEASASWDLRSFVQDVTIFDMDSDPQTPIDLENDLLYVENTYQFVLDFAETAEMQMAPNQDGLLLYQLPNQLDIQYVVPETAIYQAGTDIEIGRYTIDTTGLVTVWLDAFASDKRIIEPDEDVIESDDDAIEPDDSITEPDDDIIEPDDGVTDSNDNVTEPDNGSEPSNGNATESDDNAVQIDDSMAPLADSPYDYIRFSLEVVALLAEEGDGMLDFGNGMVAYIMPLVAALFMPLAAGDPWDLANFITIVAMYDLSQTPPVQVTPTDPTFIGNNYQFSISFAETPALQMEYDLSGVLTYQLPSALQITTAISQTPIRIANGAVVGWYTIDTTGLVTVWFDDVDQYGNPTPGTNYITLTDVTLTLDINAQLMDGAGNGLDFGNGIVVGITPPVLPPPSLTMSKTSRYDPNTERIYYIITITALGAPVSGIQLVDGPSITTSAGTTHNIINIPNAFYGFRYSLNGSTNFTPMNVNWISSATPAPTIFSYDFGDLVLNPNNFITVMYYLDLPIFIANNPQLVPSPLAYDFTVLNGAAVMGDGVPGVNDSTSDHVRKTFPISKSGTYVPPAIAGDPYQIEWTITIGDGHTTQINGGTVTDTLGANLFFQAPTAIDITLYDVVPTASFVGTADELSGFSINLANNVFTFTIPAVGDANPHGGTFGAIHEAVIVFYTDINIPPHAGQPPLIYENNLNFILGNTDVNTGGRVPFNPPTTNIISKTTSGICGNPTDGYYVEYTIVVNVPTGLYDQPLYLYDVLTVGRGGTGVANDPQNFNVTATDASGNPLPFPLEYFLETGLGVNNNAWRLYFNTTSAPTTGTPLWPYPSMIGAIITITYQIDLDPTTVATLQNDNTAQLSNAIYLINSPGDPVLSGANQNAVAGATVNDAWPIFKTGTATGNPALFNYVVTIVGGYSSRTNPLLPAGKNPAFTDTFDTRLGYVPNSFYIIDTGVTPNRYFAPAPGTDVTIVGSSISADLNSLQQFTGPPANGGVPATPAVVLDWFAYKRNFQAHYQLYLLAPGTTASALTNTASIAVNPALNECEFENSAVVNYAPDPLSKSMTPTSPGSELVNVVIVINPDGSMAFSPDGGTTVPAEITAKDVLTNLILYLDTVQIYTQNYMTIGSSKVWDGVWVNQPISYNDKALWSANVISSNEVDFVVPNQTPVMITYTALITIPIGGTGPVQNEVTIFETHDDAGNSNYFVSGSDAGAGATELDVMVFKRDNVGNNLHGATFDLYVTVLPDYSAPYGLTNVLQVPVAGGGTRDFYLLNAGVTTDANGMAVFSNPWINATYDLLFLLVETQPPYGYIWTVSQNTFFTVNPHMSPATISANETILGAPINQISDFIAIENVPDHLDPGSLRILKRFTGLTNYQIQQNLQNFQIVITDPLGTQHTFDLAAALDPMGIVLPNIPTGVYFINELNADVPGFTLATNPPLPLRRFIMPNDQGEVLIVIDNVYTRIPPPTQPPDPDGPYPPWPPTTPPGPPTEPPTQPPDTPGPWDPSNPGDSSEPPGTHPGTPPNDTGVPQTDATRQMTNYMFLLVISIVGMVGVGISGRRKKDVVRK